MKKLILIVCLALSQAQAFETQRDSSQDQAAMEYVSEYLQTDDPQLILDFCFSDSGVDTDDEETVRACEILNELE